MALGKRAHRVQAPVLRPRLEVGAVGLEEMIGHRFDARRTVHLQRDAPPDHPRREDQIRVSNRVVGMKMGHEGHPQVDRIQRGDSPVDDRGLRAPHDSCPEVHQVRRAVDDDRRRRSRPIGVGRRSSGSEQHDLRASRAR